MEKHGIVYRKLGTVDESAFDGLVRLFNREFEMLDLESVNSRNIKFLLENPHFICIVALNGEEVVGGLTGYELLMYDRPGSAMYLYDLAVAEKNRRQGIGSRLIQQLRDYCRRQGIREIFLQADISDAHALAFYESLGGKPSEVIQYSFEP